MNRGFSHIILKGNASLCTEAVKEKVERALPELTENFQHCFKKWKICMKGYKD